MWNLEDKTITNVHHLLDISGVWGAAR